MQLKTTVARIGVLCVLVAAGDTSNAQTRGQYQQARQLYTEAGILAGKKQYNEAIAKMQAALRLVPGNHYYLAYSANLESLAGRHPDAVAHALKALSLSGNDSRYYPLVMSVAQRARNDELAREYAGKVIQMGVKRVGRRHYAEAVKIKGGAKKVSAETLYDQALTLKRQANYAQAVAKVKQAMELAPEDERLQQVKVDLEARQAFVALDRHALNANAGHEQSVKSLAQYLVKPARSDLDKARLIYRWITDHIAYDADAFFRGDFGNSDAATVLRRRKGVCAGYASLFRALANEMELENIKLFGYVKGTGYTPAKLENSRHVWNVVKVDGEWRLIDCTWAAGSLNGRKFVKRFDDYYFMPEPGELVFSHLPRQERWQLLENPITKSDFRRWPKINKKIFACGFTAGQLRGALQEPGYRGLVRTHTILSANITIRSAPIQRYLKPGQRYEFVIEAPGTSQVVFVVKDRTVPFSRVGNVFVGQIAAPRGKLVIARTRSPYSKQRSSILEYVVP